MDKLYSLIIFAVLGTLGCSSPSAETLDKSVISNVTVESLASTDTIDYSTIWINKEYLSKLNSTKSQADLWDKYKISFLALAPNEESLFLVKSFETGYVYKQQIKNNQLVLIPDEPEDDTLKVKWLTKGESFMIENDTFVKTKVEDSNNILTVLMFSGEYLLDNSVVKIDEAGRVENLDEYNFLVPKYSYSSFQSNVNLIELKKPSKYPELFTYEFDGENLKLFEFYCTEYDNLKINCRNGNKGKLRYTLIKKKRA